MTAFQNQKKKSTLNIQIIRGILIIIRKCEENYTLEKRKYCKCSFLPFRIYSPTGIKSTSKDTILTNYRTYF